MTRIETRSYSAATKNIKYRFSNHAVIHSPTSFKAKRPRHRTTPEQLADLEALFDSDHSPSVSVKAALAKKLGMEIKVVNVWFQNKRQTTKKRINELTSGPETANPTSENDFLSKRGHLTRRASDRSQGSSRSYDAERSASVGSEESVNIIEAESDSDKTDSEDENKGDQSSYKKLRSSSKSNDILKHMASSSPIESTQDKQRASLLVKFGGNTTRLEWACARAYANGETADYPDHLKRTFAAARTVYRTDLPGSTKPSKIRIKNFAAAKYGSNRRSRRHSRDSDSSDEEHEAITPDSDCFPPATQTKESKSGYFAGSKVAVHMDISAVRNEFDYTNEDIEAANILLCMALDYSV